ncbi:MAG: hypothetical protein R3Y24_17530 [Eubacteriales bacterium]
MKSSKSTVIYGVMIEELERNHRMKERYLLEIETLPKGSLVVRKIGNQEYCYINYRKNRKVISQYIGKKEIINIDEWKKKINKRKHLERVIKDLQEEEKQIRKILK